MLTLTVLMTAPLCGSMVLSSFGFAAFSSTALPANVADPTIRRAFPHFYLSVVLTAAAAADLLWTNDPVAAGLLALIAVKTLPARQILMPAINMATHTGAKGRFEWLHGLSVAITLVQIGLSGLVMTRFLSMGVT